MDASSVPEIRVWSELLTGLKSRMAFDQGKSIMIFNIDFLVFHSEQKGSDCTEESMRISLPNYFVARHNERNAEGLRRFA